MYTGHIAVKLGFAKELCGIVTGMRRRMEDRWLGAVYWIQV